MEMRVFLFCVILFLSVPLIFCGSTSDWKKRTIYQLLTDRFCRTDGSSQSCSDLSNYCGGSYQGLINQLDYIISMGFDAIWISPIITNTPNGYHGYWAQDLYSLNPYFGSEADFVNFVKTAHDRGVWVMVDVVANHMGPVGYDYSSLNPFNHSSDYHSCFSYCDSNCDISSYKCGQDQIYNCRLSGLPDLNQTNPTVKTTLLNWISSLIAKYDIDGLRIDTVLEIEPSFWSDFSDSAGVYSVGECDSGNVDCLTPYSTQLPGLLSYPMFYSLRNAFLYSGQSLYQVNYTLSLYQQNFPDPDALGSFIDNHDNPRFLNIAYDLIAYKSALTYVLMGPGIPIVYYGTEQGYSGGNDPKNREPLWTSKFNRNSELYLFLQTVVVFRKEWSVYDTPYQQRALTDTFLCWTRGMVLVAVTNSKTNMVYEVTDQPYQNGQKLCNLFWPTEDCVIVSNGKVPIYLNDGEVKIFYPVSS
jgi:alpha-amylase